VGGGWRGEKTCGKSGEVWRKWGSVEKVGLVERVRTGLGCGAVSLGGGAGARILGRRFLRDEGDADLGT
jgi:hypothetical protein